MIFIFNSEQIYEIKLKDLLVEQPIAKKSPDSEMNRDFIILLTADS